MNLFEVDGYLKDDMKFWSYFTDADMGIPEPYLWIKAKCRNERYSLIWALGCFEHKPTLDGRFDREAYILENQQVYLAAAANPETSKKHELRDCD
ncbi:hypothetical protein AAVH_35070 [Aphelenchoides avenae]|nr:hypothetical protein AAVH_35070 [Aphelenchus avenae]